MVDFWVQVHDLPCGFMSEKVVIQVGNYIGTFKEGDPNNFGGHWKSYMLIRVSFDSRKPLKRKMQIKKKGGEWIWINFKYEKLNTLCFFCGIIGPFEQFCTKDYACSDPKAQGAYGAWLRSLNRKSVNAMGAHWLLDGRDHICIGGENGGSKEKMPSMESPVINANGKAFCSEDNVGDLRKGVIEGKNKGHVESMAVDNEHDLEIDNSPTNLGDGNDKDGIFIVDPKRMRHEAIGINPTHAEVATTNTSDNSKNLLLVGTGS